MAIQSTYYLDAPSLGSATVIYTDANLTIIAANGFYSDGTIVREQVSGSLLPQVSCPSCAIPCGDVITESGATGIYYLNVELGTALGAIVIKFDPQSIPDGILATINGVSYNGLASGGFGWLQGAPGLPTYIGRSASDCGIVANSPYVLNDYEYDGANFVLTGGTTNVTVLPGQMQLTANAPGGCAMVIPKTFASPSVLAIQLIGPCASTVFDIEVNCPAALPSFDSSTMHATSELACADVIDQIYYYANYGNLTALAYAAQVYSDPNGEFKLAAGFYKTTAIALSDWIQVDANGMVVAVGTCAVPPAISVTSVSGFMASCGGGLNEYMGATVFVDTAVSADTTFVVQVTYVYDGGVCGVDDLTTELSILILDGDTSSNFDACSSGFFVPGGAEICSACIISCDNTEVDFTGFACPAP